MSLLSSTCQNKEFLLDIEIYTNFNQEPREILPWDKVKRLWQNNSCQWNSESSEVSFLITVPKTIRLNNSVQPQINGMMYSYHMQLQHHTMHETQHLWNLVCVNPASNTPQVLRAHCNTTLFFHPLNLREHCMRKVKRSAIQCYVVLPHLRGGSAHVDAWGGGVGTLGDGIVYSDPPAIDLHACALILSIRGIFLGLKVYKSKSSWLSSLQREVTVFKMINIRVMKKFIWSILLKENLQ